eukprot:gb/GFBE01039685.1/.p1 GENE.gb/GFBE01039685.1/~~gb/GFBE01039685.1/.p1  ORF type:complete len:265 (+),score=44.18 gb/GFBE01039685.1/:1-795(+)
MAESTCQPTVVQATVVQGQHAQPVQMGQPVGPIQGQVIGQPVYVQQQAAHPVAWSPPHNADQQGAGTGWMLYGIGCFLCWCFGPVGPIFWFIVACMHYCKPAEVRETLPQEGQVAMVSLITAIASTIATGACIVLLVTLVATAPTEGYDDLAYCSGPCATYNWDTSNTDYAVCLNERSGECSAPYYGGGCSGGSSTTHCRQLSGMITEMDFCANKCSSWNLEEVSTTNRLGLQEVCQNRVTNACSAPASGGCLDSETRKCFVEW